ncbi:hypothetical protein [Labilithrix luteola]|nr:hypothetical protein [Labilithrix luteola]
MNSNSPRDTEYRFTPEEIVICVLRTLQTNSAIALLTIVRGRESGATLAAIRRALVEAGTFTNEMQPDSVAAALVDLGLVARRVRPDARGRHVRVYVALDPMTTARRPVA